ncbi:MAG: hypothetical protein V1872_01985 [bacterium]
MNLTQSKKLPILILIIFFYSTCRSTPSLADSLEGSADLYYTTTKETGDSTKNTYTFTQNYDLRFKEVLAEIFNVNLRVGAEYEKTDSTDMRKYETFPAADVDVKVGNRVINLRSGYSREEIRITGDQSDTLDTTRGYIDLNWEPYMLPKFNLQVDREERDYTNSEDEKTDTYRFRSNYTLPVGPFTFQHNYNWSERKNVITDADQIDTENIGRVRFDYNFFKRRVGISIDYQINDQEENIDQGEDSREQKQTINYNLGIVPINEVSLNYNFFYSRDYEKIREEKNYDLDHSVNLKVSPHKKVDTFFDYNYNQDWKNKEDIRKRVTNSYNQRTEYRPIDTWRNALSFNKTDSYLEDDLETRSNSILLQEFLALYKEVDLRLDLKNTMTNNYYDDTKSNSSGIASELKMRPIRPLTLTIRNENEWTKDTANDSAETKTEEGHFEPSATYRPIDELYISVSYDLSYIDNPATIQTYRLGWIPTNKLQYETSYEYDNEEKTATFDNNLDWNISSYMKVSTSYDLINYKGEGRRAQTVTARYIFRF